VRSAAPSRAWLRERGDVAFVQWRAPGRAVVRERVVSRADARPRSGARPPVRDSANALIAGTSMLVFARRRAAHRPLLRERGALAFVQWRASGRAVLRERVMSRADARSRSRCRPADRDCANALIAGASMLAFARRRAAHRPLLRERGLRVAAA
jgi:hypothetical protein